MQTKDNVCQSILTPYNRESADELQAWGKYNPAACTESSNVPLAAISSDD